MKGVYIERKARIGANITILPGIKIGVNALIGAGSVVLSDIKEKSVVVANPRRTINSIDMLPY